MFARIAGEHLDEYVHTEVLFYPIGSVSGVALPQLTIGAWLETAWRLSARPAALDRAQSAVFEEARASARRVRSLWPALYQHKARREFKSRLDSWAWYLDDLLGKDGPLTAQGSAYASQSHTRFKLELLRQEVSQLSGELQRLEMGDRRLRLRFVPGPFLWEPDLEAAAPREAYWWLHGAPV
jgi:hypothetical protein